MPAKADPPARGRRRLDLSMGKVLDAAHTLVQQGGPSALTMRRLGRELNADPMALYRYAGDRGRLLDALVERYVNQMLEDPLLQPHAEHDWRAFLTHLGHGVRELALAQPMVFPLLATHPPAAPWLRPPLRSLRWIEQFLSGLLERGFADDGAVAAYRAFTSFLLGHLLLEISALNPNPGSDSDSGVGPGSNQAASLAATMTARAEPPATPQDSLQHYPALARLADRLRQDHAQQEFHSALTSVLDRISRLSAER